MRSPTQSRTPSAPLGWTPSVAPKRTPSAALRLFACGATLAALAACSSTAPQSGLSSSQEAAQYQAHARRSYNPPGPAGDPWGPYIAEASTKYDIPQRWIREVIRAESSGKVFETSDPGAMGLMQVMPRTFDELRARYSLGDDAYEPHDNIMAGTAYLRELYDVYGSPGFLAAYNAGPGRLDDYLTRNRSLPDETRHYVAKIAPNIQDDMPNRPSQATDLAMNQLPIYIPAGPRYPSQRRGGAPVALADNRYGQRTYNSYSREAVATNYLPEPPRMVAPPPRVQYAAVGQPETRRGFHIIPQAMADTLPVRRGEGGLAGNWGIQVGAYGNEGQARAAAESARGQARDMLGGARPHVGSVRQASNTLYRARLVGLSRDAAMQACEKMLRGHSACIVVSPDSQS